MRTGKFFQGTFHSGLRSTSWEAKRVQKCVLGNDNLVYEGEESTGGRLGAKTDSLVFSCFCFSSECWLCGG